MNDQPSALRLAEIALEDVDYGVRESMKWADTLFRAIERADEDARVELASIGRYLMDRARTNVCEDFKALRVGLDKLREVSR